MADEVQKNSNIEHNAPLLEPFRGIFESLLHFEMSVVLCMLARVECKLFIFICSLFFSNTDQ